MLYNFVQAGGWGYILFTLIEQYFVKGKDLSTLYEGTLLPLQIFQYLAILEVFHIMLGLVPSGLMTTLSQVFSRVLCTYLVTSVEEVRESPFFMSMVAAWSITEIIRYTFYALSQFEKVPFFLLWVRYNLFWVLYPMGAGSEWFNILHSIPFFLSSRKLSFSLPNNLNFAFSFPYFLYFCLLIWPFGLYSLMSHVNKQRISQLNKRKKD